MVSLCLATSGDGREAGSHLLTSSRLAWFLKTFSNGFFFVDIHGKHKAFQTV